MHYLAVILSAPEPVTAGDYRRQLYAWGDGVYLADTLTGRVWSWLAKQVGYGRKHLDHNLSRVAQSASRAIETHGERMEAAYKSALLSVWTNPNGHSFEAAVRELDGWKKKWARVLPIADPALKERWTALSHVPHAAGLFDRYTELMRRADDLSKSWNIFLEVATATGPIPMHEFRVLIGREIINKFCLIHWERELLRSTNPAERPKASPQVKTWCQHVNESELTAEQLEKFHQLLVSAARIWKRKRKGPLALVDNYRVQIRATDRRANIGSHTREGERKLRASLDQAQKTQNPIEKRIALGTGAMSFLFGMASDQGKVVKNATVDMAKGVTGIGNADAALDIREELKGELSQKRPNPQDAVNWLKKQLVLHGCQKL